MTFGRVGRLATSSLVLATTLLASGAFEPLARAQPVRTLESPQYFAFELKFGPYAPDIDSEFSAGETPFRDIFGSGTGLLSQLEVDFQLLHLFGSLGVGLSVGYYSTSAETCATPTGGTDNCATKLSGDETTVTLVPLAALAVYRFDVLADRLSIPLVPYAKFGLNYTLWWMRRSSGSISQDEAGNKARGGNFGWQLNVGLALRLDGADPGAAQTLDADFGVNHTYLFAEMLHVNSSSEPRLGDTTVMGGLAVEF